MSMIVSDCPLRRRTLLASMAAAGASASGDPRAGRAFAQEPEKPAEIIVRAWGSSWVDALKAGVSDSFTKATGIAVRHDLTEDNEIQPKVWPPSRRSAFRRSTSTGTRRPTPRSRRCAESRRICRICRT